MSNNIFMVVMKPDANNIANGIPAYASLFRAKSEVHAEARAQVSFEDEFSDLDVDTFSALVTGPFDEAPEGAPPFGKWVVPAEPEEEADPAPVLIDFTTLSSTMQNAVLAMHGKMEVTEKEVSQARIMTFDDEGSYEGHLFMAVEKYPEIRCMYAELRLQAMQYVRDNWSAAKKWPEMKAGLHSWLLEFERDRKKNGPDAAALARRDELVTKPFKPTDAQKDRLNLIVSLITINISPDVAKASDIKTARQLIKTEDKAITVWVDSLSQIPGIYDRDGGELFTLLNKPMAPAALLDDEKGRNAVLAVAFPEHAALLGVELKTVTPPPEKIKITLEVGTSNEGEKPEVTKDSISGGESGEIKDCGRELASAPAPDKNLNANTGEDSDVAWENRKGPFYFYDADNDKVGRANKIDGLIKAIGLGAKEITKEEHAARKAGTYVEPENNENHIETASGNVAGAEPGQKETAMVGGEPEVAEIHETPEVNLNGEIVDQFVPEVAETAPEVAETAPEVKSGGVTVERVSKTVFSIDGLMGSPAPESEPDEEPAPPAEPQTFEPGRYLDIPNDVYHASNGISSTMIKDARVSLMFYKERHVTKRIKREETRALDVGSLFHVLTTEPEKFDSEFSVEPTIPEGAFYGAADYKKFIEKFNETVPEPVSVDVIKSLIEEHNAKLPQPYGMGDDLSQTMAIYQALPPDFQRLGEDDKITAAKMKACIKEFNATLPPLRKTNGNREALLDTLATFDADKADAIRNAPGKLSAAGTKADMAVSIRKVMPDAVFADEIIDAWKKNPDRKTLVTKSEMEMACSMRDAALAHPRAGKFLTHANRTVEASYYAVDAETGLEVRVRPDVEIDINNLRLGVDLKSISMWGIKAEQLKDRIRREIISRDYHLSAAMYCEVAQLDQFFWIFVNKDEHYHWVIVVEADAELLELGMLEYRKTLEEIANGYDFDEWPAPIIEDYAQGLTDHDKKRLEYLRSL